MHHGPEMSSVSLLIQLSSITPTLTPGRDDEEEEELGKKNWQRKGGKQKHVCGHAEILRVCETTHTKKKSNATQDYWFSLAAVYLLCVCVVRVVLRCVASGSDEIKHLTALYTQTQHARDQTYSITYKQPVISVVSALTEHTHLYPHVHTRAVIKKNKRHDTELDENSLTTEKIINYFLSKKYFSS